MNRTSLEYQCMLNIVMTDKCMPENDLFENIGNLFDNYLRLSYIFKFLFLGNVANNLQLKGDQ